MIALRILSAGVAVYVAWRAALRALRSWRP